jgi:hypothetical protein
LYLVEEVQEVGAERKALQKFLKSREDRHVPSTPIPTTSPHPEFWPSLEGLLGTLTHRVSVTLAGLEENPESEKRPGFQMLIVLDLI